jgi:proline dehydrogenase
VQPLFDNLGRRTILALAESPTVARVVRRWGHLFGTRRFVAGERVEDAVAVVRRLNQEGIAGTLDVLGESVGDAAAARTAARAYLDVLDAIAAAGVRSGVSLKLTQMGLDVDPSLCRAHVREILRRARQYGRFVRIDMEDSRRTAATLELYRELRRDGWDNVGVVIQAYLYRSEADLASLDELAPDVRLVKGAYNEPPTVAFPRKADVDANMRRLVARQLALGFPTAVATHDEAVIRFAQDMAARQGIDRRRFEFQMLYGIRPGLQRQLAAAGYRVRVYVPFGREWYAYLMRRLAERPANLLFVARNLFRA